MRIGALVALTGAGLLVAGCPLPVFPAVPGVTGPRVSAEDQVCAVLDDVHMGMAKRHVYTVLAHVSHRYKDAEGRDYQGVQAYLRTVFARYKEIQITRQRPKVIVQGNTAQALERFRTVAVPAAAGAEVFELEGEVKVHFIRSDGEWLITEWSAIR